jgi:predicted DNA binding CopG/RHH family protein
MEKRAEKPRPSPRNDTEAEQSAESADMSPVDAETGGLNMPQNLLAELKAKAQEAQMPYTSYIRLILARMMNK